MAERILVADDDPALRAVLAAVLEEEGFEVQVVPDGDALIRTARQTMPDLLLVDVMMPGMDGLEAIRQLRHDTRTAHLPMLLLTALDQPQQEIHGFDNGADDYIAKPFVNDVLVARVKANLRRRERASVNNPLTGLPGNLLIGAEVTRRLAQQQPFALLYADLDNFKSFNDAYGFARGDQVILLLADLLRAAQAGQPDAHTFIGHIGGDDFVALVNAASAEVWASALIAEFDAVVGDLYDPPDRERGYLVGYDRFGTPRRFPIVSLSIGGVDARQHPTASFDDLAALASEIKNVAKQTVGSQYVLDERHGPHAAPEGVIERRGLPPLIGLAILDPAVRAEWERWCATNGCRSSAFDELPAAGPLMTLDPSLVLLDLRQPNAWTWLDQIRLALPALPIIGLATPAGDQARALQSGVEACFIMPAAPELVALALIHLLRLSTGQLRARAPRMPRP